MRSLSSSNIEHGYSVIRLVRDPLDSHAMPVGVAVWDFQRNWFSIRCVNEDESLPKLSRWERTVSELATKQILMWAERQRVPYARETQNPASVVFWESVSDVMTTTIQFDHPKAMDPMENHEEEFELLYTAIVKPDEKSRTHDVRVDGALSSALGEALGSKISRKLAVSAFGDANEVVRRGVRHGSRLLLIDGVNLASKNARSRADELVSKFLRIKKYYPPDSIDVVIGYWASPGGLNGEAHMKEWIETNVTSKVFDLSRQKIEMQQTTREIVESMEAQMELPLECAVSSEVP